MVSGKPSPVLQFIHKIADDGACPYLADRELLQRFVRGDQSAFAELVERHGPAILGVCRRILGPGHDADDAFQATFLVLARKAGPLCSQDLLSPWLHGVAVRTALKARTRAWRQQAHERPLIDVAEAAPADVVVRRELRQVLDEELNRLSAKYQKPLVLCYLEGKTVEEAGRILGCPKGTIQSRLARGRDKLRTRLTKRGLALSAGALATALADSPLSAAMPAGLVQATVEASCLFLSKTAGAGAASAPVAAIAKGVLTAMFMTKVKTAALLLVLLAGIAVGALALHASARDSAGFNRSLSRPRSTATAASLQADDRAGAPTLVDRAIKALGGRKKLSNFTAGTCKIKGKVLDAQGDLFDIEASLQGADRVRLEGELTRDGMSVKATIILNGDKGWAKFADNVKDSPKEAVVAIKDIIRAFRYVHAVTPLKDKGVTLSPLGEVNVDGKPAVGLKVACKDEQDIHVFFDKATSLPLKAELKAPNRAGAEDALEFTFSDYKEFDGRKHFTKVGLKINGTAFFEVDLSDYRWLEKLEASTFERP
jgi:RNA polymerase sigma factor (sigma-70 family)